MVGDNAARSVPAQAQIVPLLKGQAEGRRPNAHGRNRVIADIPFPVRLSEVEGPCRTQAKRNDSLRSLEGFDFAQPERMGG